MHVGHDRAMAARIGAVCAGLMILVAAQGAVAASAAPPLTLAEEGSFFVGGRDVHSETLSANPKNAQPGTVTVDQVYVRYQIPANAGKHRPITLIHGCCLTGKTWETTPDGRMGWEEYFVRHGHPTYVIDQAWRGRSASDPSRINAVKLKGESVDQLPSVSFASHEGAWTLFRFGATYPETFPGLQFPLEAQAEFWKQMVPDWATTLPTPNPTVPGLSELATRLKGAVLISHSQSGIYPFQVAAMNRENVVGIVAIEPAACPAATENLTPYTHMPILVMFGDFVAASPVWSSIQKNCAAFMQAANAAGGHVELVSLPDVGFHGNSHMLMEDKNSLDIVAWLAKWIDRHIG
jgi:pimeloyl-ACP methyl ester carboxylesterase